MSFGKTGGSSPGSVWNAQAPFLQGLYQSAQNIAAGQYGGQGRADIQPVQGGAYAQAGRRPGRWDRFLGPGMGRGAPVAGNPAVTGGGGLPDITQFSQGLAGGLFQQANQGSPWLSGQIQGLGADIGQFYNQQILPGIANEAGGASQYGTPRQGIAQGMASQDALRLFQQGATDLRAQDYAQGPARAAQLYNLGMAPYSAQFQPLQQLAALLGGPTILGGGSSGGFNIGLFG